MPVQNRKADSITYWVTGTSVPPGQDDGADEGGQQQHGHGLEGDDVTAEDRIGDRAGGGRLGGVQLVSPELVGQQIGEHPEDQERHRPRQGPLVVVVLGRAPHRRPGQHDAEEEQHDDRADVDEDLDDPQELRLEEDVLGGDPGQHDDQGQGGVDDVLHGRHAEARHRHTDGDDPEGDVLGGGGGKDDRHYFFPLTSAPTSSGSGGLTVSIHSPSLSLSWSNAPMRGSEYSYSGLQNRASNGQTSTQMPQYMHRA